MRTLPADMQSKLQPRLKIIWVGRRARYEWVEEVSNGIFRFWIIFGLAYKLDYYTDYFGGWMYWCAVGIILLLSTQHAIFEVLEWQNEVYVVARDEVNGGGRIYKFWGWLNKRYVDEAITPSSPTILPEQPWFFRLWGWITGEQMMKVKLASVNHVYIEGKKISPQFERAIKFIRGYRPAREEIKPHDITRLADLNQARVDGLLTDQQARQAAAVIIQRAIYGE